MKKKYIAIAITPLLVVGCAENKDTSTQHNPHMPKVDMPSVKAPSEFSPHAAQLADAVQQSQARLASSRSDVCPKLIEFQVGNNISIRQNEVMRRQSCKYFLYPSAGEKLTINLSNIKMKAQLVQPELFEFSNGEYTVQKPGKHVLEIRYKDHHGDREPEQYNLIVKTL